MKYKKEILRVILVIVLLSLITPPLVAIYGLPFGNLIAKTVINKYIVFHYPQQKLSIGKISFNLKDSAYDTNILDKNAKVFTEIKYFWKDNSLVDTKFNQELDESLDKMIKKKVQELMPTLIVDSESWATLKVNGNFHNSPERDDVIYITFQNKEEGFVLSKEQYIDFVRKLINYLKQNKYNIEKIQIDYIDRNYIKKNSYMLQLNKTQVNLPKEEMSKLI
ncbi:MAG: YfjL-like protein, partial [Eubacteriales bacterium]